MPPRDLGEKSKGERVLSISFNYDIIIQKSGQGGLK